MIKGWKVSEICNFECRFSTAVLFCLAVLFAANVKHMAVFFPYNHSISALIYVRHEPAEKSGSSPPFGAANKTVYVM